MIHKNSARFRQCKIINTETSELEIRNTRQVTDVAVMLLLRASLRAADTCCASEGTNDILEEAPETTKVVREEKSGTSENWLAYAANVYQFAHIV
jgi:hypothetical protein